MSCEAKTCVLDVLEPVFGDEAGNIAMSFTCFPESCDVASEQGRKLVERVAVVGKVAALAEVQDEIDAQFAEIVAKGRFDADE